MPNIKPRTWGVSITNFSFTCSTTCAYLACKVDEFNVSLRDFVGNLKKDREKISDQILWFELTIMQILNFHLTIHTAYRPLEGLFINLKVSRQGRCAVSS